MRILIVAGNASDKMGGEAVLPLRYFLGLRGRGIDAFLLTHARCREELMSTYADRAERFFFVEDARSEILVYRIGLRFPHPIREALFFPLIGFITNYRLSLRARRLCASHGFSVLHQPVPVSPRAPSFFYRQPAAVIIGPMNGNMDYPPALVRTYSKGTQTIIALGRRCAKALNWVIPGKRQAACLLAANERTAATLRKDFPNAKIRLLPENGVDLQLWTACSSRATALGTPCFLFVGRLVHWKAVDILIDAFALVDVPAQLLIIGDGPEFTKLQSQALRAQGIGKTVSFLGYQDHDGVRRAMQKACALVLPSLRESGGAVILEAMASGLPVIATKWGGPEDYVTNEVGFLVEPRSRDYMVRRIAELMNHLAINQKSARLMGKQGRARVEKYFSWATKIDEIVKIYANALGLRSELR